MSVDGYAEEINELGFRIDETKESFDKKLKNSYFFVTLLSVLFVMYIL